MGFIEKQFVLWVIPAVWLEAKQAPIITPGEQLVCICCQSKIMVVCEDCCPQFICTGVNEGCWSFGGVLMNGKEVEKLSDARATPAGVNQKILFLGNDCM